jgi:transposase
MTAVQMIDTSVVRVHQHGAYITNSNGQHIGRSRGGLTSKIHVVVDGNGLPVRLGLTGGQAHDNRLCSVLAVTTPSSRAVADRSRLRRGLDQGICHGMGSVGEYPTQAQSQGPCLLQPLSLPRSQSGRTILQQDQAVPAVATRYHKLAANYLAFVKLACMRLWLRVYECTA